MVGRRWIRCGTCLSGTDGVLPTYAVDRGEGPRETHLLLPGGVRPRRRPTPNRGPTVPGHRRGRAGAAVGHRDRRASLHTAQAVRGPGRGLVDAGAPGRGR